MSLHYMSEWSFFYEWTVELGSLKIKIPTFSFSNINDLKSILETPTCF